MGKYSPLAQGYQEQVEALDMLIQQFLKNREVEKLNRLKTYLRRYISPLIVDNLFLQKNLSLLIQQQRCESLTALMLDLRGFVKTTVISEQSGEGLNTIAKLLQTFFAHIIRIAFENYGLVGEFAGDRVLLIFGFPSQSLMSLNDVPDLASEIALNTKHAINTAFTIQRVVEEIKRGTLFPARILDSFEVGIGIATNGPAWIGDISSINTKEQPELWRQELTVISKAANIASRAEDMTKEEASIKAAPHRKIIIDDKVFQYIADTIDSSQYKIAPLGKIKIRGLDESIAMYHFIDLEAGIYPTLEISDAHRDLVDWICDYIEGAIERQKTNEVQRAWLDVQQISANDTPNADVPNPESVFQQIVDSIGHLFRAEKATFYEYDALERVLVVRSSIGNSPPPPGLRFKPGEGISGQVAQSGEPFRSDDVRQSKHYIATYDAKVRSMMCVPLKLQGRILGVLQVMSDELKAFDERDLQALGMFANPAALALHNAQIYEQERRVANARTRIVETLTVAANKDQVFEYIMEAVKDALQPNAASLYLVDHETGELILTHSFSQNSNRPRLPQRVLLGAGVVGQVIEAKTAYFIEDLAKSGWLHETNPEMQSIICVPMIARGNAVGALEILDVRPNTFTKKDLEILQWLATTAAVAVEATNRLEKERRKLIASETIAALGAMASKLAHNIKNDVGLILALTKLDMETDDPNLQENINIIKQRAGKTLAQVDRILRPIEDWQPKRVDINRILTAFVSEIRKELQESREHLPKIRIEQYAFPAPIFVNAGEEQLKFIFQNLVDNAVRSINEKGEGNGVITLETTVEQIGLTNYCVVKVSDNGTGIPAAALEKIFEQSYTTRPEGTIGGFGLFYVRLNIERIEGRIFATSIPGNETVFNIQIPLSQAEDAS